MPQEVLNILLSALGVIVTGLASFLVAKLTQWLNSKISDAKAANYLSTIATIVFNGVQTINQTYVDTIKKEGKFDEEAQKEAYNRCLVTVKAQLMPDLIDYITKNFGDMDEYLRSLIESTVRSLKA